MPDTPDGLGNIAGLYPIEAWAAKEGTDKNWRVALSAATTGTYTSYTYTVPPGKTLYITQVVYSVNASLAADRDLNQFGEIYLIDDTTTTTILQHGGNGGGAISLPKPITIPENHDLIMRIRNCANHYCDLAMTINGFQL